MKADEQKTHHVKSLVCDLMRNYDMTPEEIQIMTLLLNCAAQVTALLIKAEAQDTKGIIPEVK